MSVWNIYSQVTSFLILPGGKKKKKQVLFSDMERNIAPFSIFNFLTKLPINEKLPKALIFNFQLPPTPTHLGQAIINNHRK